METGRNANKALTSTTGVGVSNSATSTQKIVMPIGGSVSTSGHSSYVGEDESTKVLTGPGGGEIAGNGGANPHRWGHTTPSGSRFEVNDSLGSERIDVMLHDGSGLVIEPDGSMFISSKSQRGVGVSSPFGDFFINSGGDIVIKGGASVTVDTPGDLNLTVGGTIFMKSAAMSIITGNLEETIDGSKSVSIKNDFSSIIGGISRQTIAGDSRVQVTGVSIIDVGGNLEERVGGTANISAGGDAQFVSGGNLTTSGAGMNTVYSGGAVKLTGSIVNASPYVDLAKWADDADKSNKAGVANSLGAGANAGPKPSVSAGSAGTLSAPQVMEAIDIVDTLTSERKYPEYPSNAVLEHANAAGMGTISHDTQSQAQGVYDEYSGGNQGNMNPSYQGESVTTLPETPSNRSPDIAPVNSNFPIPAPNNLNQKISKYFTLGQILNGTTTRQKPSPENWNNIIGHAINLANNVLDPVKEKFPNILVTSYYRAGTSNHGTGRAVDIVVESRSTAKHAEIARFARDNLPCDQVFLEKNNSGRTHVHLRLSLGKGNPKVMTCGDPQCHSKTAGIDVSYLLRFGAPNT